MLKKSNRELDEAFSDMGGVSYIPVPVGIIKGVQSVLTFAYNSLTCCKKKPVKAVEASQLSTAAEALVNLNADSQAACSIVVDTDVVDTEKNTAAAAVIAPRTSPYPLRTRTAAKYYSPS